MPKRMLRDWTCSEKMNTVGAEVERFFTRLIMKADDNGCFHAHPKLLKAKLFPLLELSDDQIIQWLNSAEEIGLILVYDVEGKKFLQINDFGQRLRQVKSDFPQPDRKSRTSCGESRPEDEGEEEEEEEVEGEEEAVVSIVEVLNKITGSSFRSKSKNTKKFISARLLEKYQFEDFEKVITAKFIEWGADEKMKNYLRPETLFGTKFESYLQSANFKTHESITTGTGKQNNYQGNKADVASLVTQTKRMLEGN